MNSWENEDATLRREAREKWLAGLQVGSVLVIRTSRTCGFDDDLAKATIDGMTPTQIRIGHRKFRRKDGALMGERGGCSIEPLTDEIRKIWRDAALRSKIVAFCNDVAYSRVKIADLPMRKRLALLAAIEMPDLPEEPEQQALPGVADASK